MNTGLKGMTTERYNYCLLCPYEIVWEKEPRGSVGWVASISAWQDPPYQTL